MTKTCKNSYLIVTMACCREIYSRERHGNCVGAKTKEEAKQQFDQNIADEEKAKKDEIEKDELIEILRKRISEFEAEKQDESESNDQQEESRTEKDSETQARGDSKNLVKGNLVQNFVLIAGAAPGNGVKADTKLIGDVMRTFMELFDKMTLTVEFPIIL